MRKEGQTTQDQTQWRLERMERMVALLVADKVMSATPNPGGHRKLGYPESDKKYADPQDKAYPLDMLAHIRNAASRLAQYKERYSGKKRAEIARRIEEAEKKHGIGKYHDPSKTESANDSLKDVLDILKEVMDEPQDEPLEALALLRQVLQSEDNPRTTAEQGITDSMVDSFMREVKGHDYGRG